MEEESCEQSLQLQALLQLHLPIFAISPRPCPHHLHCHHLRRHTCGGTAGPACAPSSSRSCCCCSGWNSRNWCRSPSSTPPHPSPALGLCPWGVPTGSLSDFLVDWPPDPAGRSSTPMPTSPPLPPPAPLAPCLPDAAASPCIPSSSSCRCCCSGCSSRNCRRRSPSRMARMGSAAPHAGDAPTPAAKSGAGGAAPSGPGPSAHAHGPPATAAAAIAPSCCSCCCCCCCCC